MALENSVAGATKRKRGTAPARRRDDKDRVPVEILRDQWDRPLILSRGTDGNPAEKGEHLTAYVRASSLGEEIENRHAIEMRNQRYLAHGLGQSRALWMLAKGTSTPDEPEDRKVLDGLVKDALKRAGADDLADLGSALHALHVRQTAGEVLDPAELEEDADALAAMAQAMTMFEVLGVEVFVVNDDLGAAGTFDYLVRLLVDITDPVSGEIIPAGTILALDLKTASTARYFGAKFGTQLLVYAGGLMYDPATGERTEFPCSQRWALILHAPSGGSIAQIHIVDLDDARKAAEAALKIREVRKLTKMITLLPEFTFTPESGPMSTASCPVHGFHGGTADCVDCIYAEPGEPVAEAYRREPERLGATATFREHAAAGDARLREPERVSDAIEAATAPVMANGALVHKPGCECFGCTGETFAARVGRRLDEGVKRGPTAKPLMEAIRLANSRAELDELWAERHAEFGDTHKAVAAVRVAKFEAMRPAS